MLVYQRVLIYPLKIVDLPIENGGSFHSYVALPMENSQAMFETTSYLSWIQRSAEPPLRLILLGGVIGWANKLVGLDGGDHPHIDLG